MRMQPRAIVITVIVLLVLAIALRWAEAESPQVIQLTQTCLGLLGFSPGPIDGKAGPKTGAAADRYLRSRFGPQYMSVPDDTVGAVLLAECKRAWDSRQAQMAPTAQW